MIVKGEPIIPRSFFNFTQKNDQQCLSCTIVEDTITNDIKQLPPRLYFYNVIKSKYIVYLHFDLLYKNNSILIKPLITKLPTLEGRSLDSQLGVVADALGLGVVVVVAGSLLRPADPGEESGPESSSSSSSSPGLPPPLPPGWVAGAGADGQAVSLQGVQVETFRPAVASDDLLVQGDDVRPHLV